MVEKRCVNCGKLISYYALRCTKCNGILTFQRNILNNPSKNPLVAKKISETRKKLFKEGKLKSWNEGLTKETNIKLKEIGEKITKSLMGKLAGEKNYWYGRNRPEISFRNKQNKGKTYEELYGEEKANKIKKSISRKGEKHHNYGKRLSKVTKIKIGLGNKGKLLGEKNPAWLEGISFEPYSPEFNDELCCERIRSQNERKLFLEDFG